MRSRRGAWSLNNFGTVLWLHLEIQIRATELLTFAYRQWTRSLQLLLPGSRDRFEPSLLSRAQNRAQIEGFIADVRAWLSVVDALNLNTRIWSKS